MFRLAWSYGPLFTLQLLHRSHLTTVLVSAYKTETVGKWVCCAQSLSHVWLFETPMVCSLPGISVHGILQAKITGVGYHALLPGIEPRSPALQADSLPPEPHIVIAPLPICFNDASFLRRYKDLMGNFFKASSCTCPKTDKSLDSRNPLTLEVLFKQRIWVFVSFYVMLRSVPTQISFWYSSK